jgi:integrase/recombinase XerD
LPAAAPGPAHAAGLSVSEVVALKVSDIDSERLLLRIEQGNGRKVRFAMLSPRVVGPAARLVSDRPADGLAVPRP